MSEEQLGSDQSVICDGCNVRPPFEHRCANDGCECELCMVACEVCGGMVPEREARDWEWRMLPEGVFPICPGCRT